MGLSLNLRKQVNGFRLDVEWAMENELAVLFWIFRCREIDDPPIDRRTAPTG